jgi:hypothetical protein|tara:strand:- start:738 stop:887 length:150 start_codon:yes stop_codon:yes gene_type:complete
MNKISNRVWSEYANVIGGDFLNWYEGLSPIEAKVWSMKFNEIQSSEIRG